jgi:hypothetical protein
MEICNSLPPAATVGVSNLSILGGVVSADLAAKRRSKFALFLSWGAQPETEIKRKEKNRMPRGERGLFNKK